MQRKTSRVNALYQKEAGQLPIHNCEHGSWTSALLDTAVILYEPRVPGRYPYCLAVG